MCYETLRRLRGTADEFLKRLGTRRAWWRQLKSNSLAYSCGPRGGGGGALGEGARLLGTRLRAEVGRTVEEGGA